VSLGELVRGELAAFADLDDPNLSVGGPEITLTPRAGQGLGLALHELATNAAKYGALGQAGGRLTVQWREDADRIVIEWAESGVVLAGTPERSGFGSTLIDRIAPSEMSATVRRTFTTDGLTCSIVMEGTARA
jgi:two-component sensor histidine kinase